MQETPNSQHLCWNGAESDWTNKLVFSQSTRRRRLWIDETVSERANLPSRRKEKGGEGSYNTATGEERGVGTHWRRKRKLNRISTKRSANKMPPTPAES